MLTRMERSTCLISTTAEGLYSRSSPAVRLSGSMATNPAVRLSGSMAAKKLEASLQPWLTNELCRLPVPFTLRITALCYMA